MPEGDAVWLTARRLHETLAGRVLTRSDFRVPRYATTDLTGRTVTECVAPGSHRIRLVLANDTWQAVGYQLGIVEVLPTAREARVVGHLGPDLLGPDWDPAEAARRLRAAPARPVGEALLDQRNLAGIGNIYKAEVLFLRGVDPWRPVGEVAGLDALVSAAQQLMDANKERFSQVTTGVRRPGEQTWVYGRAGRP